MGFPTHHRMMICRFFRSNLRRGGWGVSLVEMAMVLVVLGLLMVTLLLPFSTTAEQKKVNETKEQMRQILEAVKGFARSSGGLPPPAVIGAGATDADRWQNSDGSGGAAPFPLPCAHNECLVPWRTLGLPKEIALDRWGRPLRYYVWLNNHNENACIYDLNGALITEQVAVVLVSHGRNGLGAYLFAPGTPTDPNQNENTTQDREYHTGPMGNPDDWNAYDDIVVWLSRYELCAVNNNLPICNRNASC